MRSTRPAICMLLILVSTGQPSAWAAAELTSLQLGLQGTGKVGCWLPIQLTAEDLPPNTDVELRIAASDPAGDTCIEIADSGTVNADGQITMSGVFRVGRLEGAAVVSIVPADGTVPLLRQVVEHGVLLSRPEAEVSIQSSLLVRKLNTRMLLTFGQVAGIEELLRNAVTYSPNGQLVLDGVRLDSTYDIPLSRHALESVDIILLPDRYDISSQQTELLRQWVRSGGRLIVSVAKEVPAFLETEVGRWIGNLFDVDAQPISVRDLTSMQSFVSGASRLETNRDAWPMAIVRTDQIFRNVNSLRGPIVGTQSYGSGVLTFVAVDLNRKPVSQWKSLPQFYEVLLLGERLTNQSGSVSKTSRISQSGVSDIGTQMLAAVDAQATAGGWSTWAIMAMIAGYLTLIGPIDYLLVSRLLKKPHLTWLTFPLMIAGGAFLMMGASGHSSSTLNQLHLIDVMADQNDKTLTVRSWMSVATADTMRADFEATVAESLAVENGLTKPVISWSGRPEDVYGGMYRTGGVGMGRQSYQHHYQQQAKLTSVPMLINGSRSLYTAWSEPADKDLAVSRLAASGYGLLTGTFQHEFPDAIRDWTLVSGNRIYRAEAGSKLAVLEPNERCAMNAAAVYASDAKAFLNGSRIVSKTTGRTTRGSSQVVTPYDSRSTDLSYIMTMASLYEAAGGPDYVGLSQTQLRAMDVSDTLRLNHAVLIGRVDTAATDLSLAGTHLQPNRNTSIIRIFLPIDRRPGGEMARTKEDIEKEKQDSDD